MSAGLIIPTAILDAADLKAEELLIELAVYLYDHERLSIGQAKNLAQLDLITFQKEFAKSDVYIKYDVEDFNQDLRTIRGME